MDTKTTNRFEELKKEIAEEQQIIKGLPWWGFLGDDTSPPGDDKLRAKHIQSLMDKQLELMLIVENERIDDVVRKHEELHPSETFECPICLETISMSDDLDNAPVMYQCCGGANCRQCGNMGTKFSKCPLCRAELPKGQKESMAEFVKSAESGKAWAQSKLGHAYLHHRMALPYDNPPRNVKKGLKFIKLAAEQDEPTALYALGQFHYEGMNGIKKDVEKAKVFFERASNKGHTKSQMTLGVLAFGRGTDDYAMKRAVHYFSLACNKDDTGEIDMMFAQLCEHGKGGFEKSLLLSKHYYGEAAKKGDKRAFYPLAKILMEVHRKYFGIPISGHCLVPLAMYWAVKAKEAGEESASVFVEKWEGCMSRVCFNTTKCKCKGGATSSNVKKNACSRCKSVWYCSKECQVENWKDGHKFDCVKQG